MVFKARKNGDGTVQINVKLIYLIIAVIIGFGTIVGGTAKGIATYVEWRIDEKAFSKEAGTRIEEQLKAIQTSLDEIKKAVEKP